MVEELIKKLEARYFDDEESSVDVMAAALGDDDAKILALGKRFYVPFENERRIPPQCMLRPDVGCCHDHAWYYDRWNGECRGYYPQTNHNPNHFSSKSECQKTCMEQREYDHGWP